MTSIILEPPILLAAGIDWLEAILPVLFVGFWILSQVFAILRRVGGGPAPPPVVRLPEAPRPDAPRPEARRMPQPAGDIDPRAELEKQITDFLRQVTGENAGADRPPRRPQPKPQPAPTLAAPKPGGPRPQAEQPLRPKSAQAPRAVGALATESSDVARHVQDAFAHELGHLHSGLEAAEPAKGVATKPPARAGLSGRDLVAAARDPATIRQAILLREILERPVDRW
jgi:hypothetical protein